MPSVTGMLIGRFENVAVRAGVRAEHQMIHRSPRYEQRDHDVRIAEMIVDHLRGGRDQLVRLEPGGDAARDARDQRMRSVRRCSRP